jgi:hypothetical protein
MSPEVLVMMLSFVPKQGEISVQVEFAQPSFLLFSDVLQLGRALWKYLSPLGMRLPDMKFEGGNISYNEAHVQCFLFSYAAELNVRPDRIDIKSFDTAKQRDAFAAVSAATVAARERAADAEFRSCTSVIAMHGQLESSDRKSFLDRFVREAPVETGKQMSAGIVFYFEPAGKRLASSLTLEPSFTIQDGLFIRSTTIWSLEGDELTTLADTDAKYSSDLLESFNITVKR